MGSFHESFNRLVRNFFVPEKKGSIFAFRLSALRFGCDKSHLVSFGIFVQPPVFELCLPFSCANGSQKVK